MIDDKVNASLRDRRQDIEKISGNSKAINIGCAAKKQQRKSNEEQSKDNSSISIKLEAEQSLDNEKIQESRDKIVEGN